MRQTLASKRTTSLSCLAPGCARAWLIDALDKSGMPRAELARRLSDLFGKTISGAAVGKMIAGKRVMQADEMLAIAQICRVPLPKTDDAKLRSSARFPGAPDLFASAARVA